MLQILSDYPDNVVDAAARDVVSRRDYQNILVPRVELTLKRHPKICCYYELGSKFSGMEAGAIWEDFKIGVEHLTRWERVAVVTDVDWIRHAINVFRFLMPGEDRTEIERLFELVRAVVGHRPKHGAAGVAAMTSERQILFDEALRHRMYRREPDLAALAFSPDLEGQRTAPVGSTDERQNGPDTRIAHVEAAPCHHAQKQ
jgi:SpoIIAA-like